MRKTILGIMVIAMFSLINLYFISSDGTLEKLVMLRNIEVLANTEGSNNGKELRSFYCENGNEYYECRYADSDDNCDYSEETFCGAGNSPAEGGTESSGEANDLCKYSGHIFSETLCYRTCIRCGLTTNICKD
ncbi:MAG: hypothetical protein IJX44_08110 [Bacteroidaceae bacterium]|nr:hypothetical protein [Bacteroidaceae bacterium]